MAHVGSTTLQAALVPLMKRVREHDEAAFDEVYDRTRVQVLRAVTAILRSPEHAAEVVQEVYLFVWLNAESFDEARGSALGWLLMLARRRAVDRVRHVVRARVRDENDAATLERTVPDVADLGLARQEATQLRVAVGRLSVVQRDAVALTFLDGYTHEQAAVLLRVPLGTLKTRVRAGVLSLRGHLVAAAA